MSISQSRLRRNVAVGLLSACEIAGVYCIHGIAISGGLLLSLLQGAEEQPRKFPGTDVVMITKITGIAALDNHVNNLITFWTPIIFRSDGTLNLFTPYFMVQWVVVFVIIFLECLRHGNRGKWVGSFALFGEVVQQGGLGPVAPAYFALHLLTSPTASVESNARWDTLLSISLDDLGIWPWSTAIGFILPTVLWMIPSPSIISGTTMHVFQILWQPFPVYMVIIQATLRHFWPSTAQRGKSVKGPNGSDSYSSARYQDALSQTYKLILGVSIASHVPTILLALAKSSLWELLVPPAPLLSWKMSSIANGVHVFLLWDFHITALACLIWAVTLFVNTVAQVDGGVIPWKAIAVKVVGWTVIAGPFGAATVLIWERDLLASRKVRKAT